MQASDREQFYKMWAAAWEMVGKSVTENQLKLCFNVLMNYRLDDIRQALGAHMRDPERGRFAPTPADITNQIAGSLADQATAIWPAVLRGIRGSSRNYVALADPVAHVVVQDMGGLCHMGRLNESEMPFLQKEFVKRYVIVKRGWTDSTPYPAKLRARDHLVEGDDRVEYIGPPEHCERVLLGHGM